MMIFILSSSTYVHVHISQLFRHYLLTLEMRRYVASTIDPHGYPKGTPKWIQQGIQKACQHFSKRVSKRITHMNTKGYLKDIFNLRSKKGIKRHTKRI